LPTDSAGLTTKLFAVLSKDVRLEFRTRYAFNTILMFGVTTLAMISFSLGQSNLPVNLLAAIFWIVIFFSAMAALSQVFVREEEAQTALALRLTADPSAVYLGKLLFNFGLLGLISFVVTPLFFVLTDAPTGRIDLFVLVLVLGVIGLCAATTLVAAIISKAAVRGSLFAVMCFPILVLPLLMLVKATEVALAGGAIIDMAAPLQGLIAYAAIMVTASLMLFKFVWRA